MARHGPERPYAAKYYHPHNWRGWWDFGCGALGDMGCHTANLPFMALKLRPPDEHPRRMRRTQPRDLSRLGAGDLRVPRAASLPPVKLIWYEGHKDGKLVQPPRELIEKVVAEYNKVLAPRETRRCRAARRSG